MLFPTLTMKTQDEKDGTDDPIGNHGNPNADHTERGVFGQINAKPNPKYPHREDGHTHCETDVVCGPKGVGKGEG